MISPAPLLTLILFVGAATSAAVLLRRWSNRRHPQFYCPCCYTVKRFHRGQHPVCQKHGHEVEMHRASNRRHQYYATQRERYRSRTRSQ